VRRNDGGVVVTGAGSIGAQGLGLDALAAQLAAGATTTRPIERLPGVPLRPGSARTASLVDADWTAYLAPRAARRMSPPSIYAVVAARMALEAAGVEVPDEPDDACGVLLATAFGASSYTQRLLDQILAEGPEAISPFLFMESVANAPAGQVAIHCRAGGPNHTLCQREAGPAGAVGRAAAEVAAGRAERMLAGAVEEVTPLLHTVLDRFGALSDRPRPFDRQRDGFLAAEGSTVLLLETETAARQRGTEPLARVTAWGGAFDPTAPRSDWGTGGAALAESLVRGLARRGLVAADVDAVVSGASGARRGDHLEAEMLRHLFAGSPPLVLAPKGTTGEYGGAYLGAALAALAGLPVARPAGFSEADPELSVAPGELASGRGVRRVLVTGCAAGGSASWVILEAPGATS
jgi:3-oxoacyl-[acyl-carrier-protein] synthase II